MVPRVIFLSSLVFIFGSLHTSAVVAPDGEPGCERVVVRAAFDHPAMISSVTRWTDPWEVDRDEGVLIVDVSPDELARLESDGFVVEIDHDLTRMMCTPRHRLKGQKGGIVGLPCYRTVDETFLDVELLVLQYPDLAEWIDIGDSWELNMGQEPGFEGDDIMVLKLGNRWTEGVGTTADPDSKPILFVQAGIHARECPAPELLVRFAEDLLNSYGVDADSTWLLDEHEIHLVLFLNPDGRRRAEEGQWWRKNANNDHCTDSRLRGIDLNRNFDFRWNCCGQSSNVECDQTYHGTGGASEPETRAAQDYLRSIFPSQWAPEPPADATGVFFDLHSYGRQVFWPWFHTSTPAPNGTAHTTLGRKLAFFNNYSPEEVNGSLDGSAVDFAYGDLGVASFLFEFGTEFFQDCDRFENWIVPDNMEALRYAAKVARTPFITPSGPDVTTIDFVTGPSVYSTAPLSIRATGDDGRFRNSNGVEPIQNVTAIRVNIDRPPWHPNPGGSRKMDPVDGAYDSSIETAELTIDTTGLAPGRHTLFVRAKDANGVWGPVSAEFFWIHGADGPIRRPQGRVEP